MEEQPLTARIPMSVVDLDVVSIAWVVMSLGRNGRVVDGASVPRSMQDVIILECYLLRPVKLDVVMKCWSMRYVSFECM